MALKKKKIRKINLPELNVNITALLDVLTVLLFFLIKSFSTSSISTIPPEDLRLPASIIQDEVEEAMTVILSRDQLIVQDKLVATLNQGTFKASDIASDERTITKLKEILDGEYIKRSRIFKNAGNLDFLPPGKITITSDKRLQFGAIKHLLYTAAQSGYTDYQFVVDGENK